MKGFIGFTKRNILIYFKDIHSVIFSLLTSIITFVLYLLFLKGTFVDAIDHYTVGLENFVTDGQIKMLVNGILLTGVIGSALITVPFNCLLALVKDREQKVDYDILATPVKRSQIILSYFSSTVICSFIVSALILTVGLIILSTMGNLCMDFITILYVFATVLLGAISATAFFMPIMLLFKSSSASGAFFGILSAASGFVIGAYIPLSQFSDTVQTVCNIFPASHITILMRNHILNGILEDIDASIGGIDAGAFLQGIKDTFSFEARMFGSSLTNAPMIMYVLIFSVIFTGIMIFTYGKTYKRN